MISMSAGRRRLAPFPTMLRKRRGGTTFQHTMVATFSTETVFQHPWERVTAASWRKYAGAASPASPNAAPPPTMTHVMCADTLDRRVDVSAGRMDSTRVFTVKWPLPGWIARSLGGTVAYSLEQSTVDVLGRTMDLTTTNLTLRDFLEVKEKCQYVPHPENPEWTVFRSQTEIRLKAFKGWADELERKVCRIFEKNSGKGKLVVEHICNMMVSEKEAEQS